MMRTCMVGLAIVFNLPLTFAQDFHKSYDLSTGGQILIGTFLGNVKVAGYTGNKVEIKAYKKGPDRDSIQISDRSFGNRIELIAQYPPFYNGASSVDFDIRVPNSVEYNFDRLSSFGGDVEISDVSGRLRAGSIRGSVDVKDVRGMVSASSVSGHVSVEIKNLQAPSKQIMNIYSVSGNIDVSAPANMDAVIDMSTVSGTLKTDFPIDIQEQRYGSGRWARGKLGSGKQILRITSVSGRVSLIHK
jgi:hypothetical protein